MAANTIFLSNTFALIDGPAKYVADRILSYKQKGYQFTQAYRRGGWDGQIHLLRRDGRFPAGLASWLAERLQRQGIEFRVDDQRPTPPQPLPQIANLPCTIELRPHQIEAVDIAERNERGVVWHPTAAGKTEVMIELARRIARPGLVLVHRKDLMYQSADRFAGRLDKKVVGIIGDGLWHPNLLTVATFQTLYLRVKDKDQNVLRWLREEIAQVHVDEAHHLPAKSYEAVMGCLPSARWRYGYSATPWKEGDLETFFKIASWLGPTIHYASPQELTEQGRLVPADVFMIRMPPPLLNYQSWPDAVEFGIVTNGVRNNMIADLARSLDESRSGPVVILVERLAHGRNLASLLGTDFVAGDAPTPIRQQAWEDLRTGQRNLLVTSKIADEGLDIPPLCFLILAGGGKAPHLTVQRVGRGMRLSKGKERLFVIDLLDTGRYLGQHSKRRLQTYQEQKAYHVETIDFETLMETIAGKPDVAPNE